MTYDGFATRRTQILIQLLLYVCGIRYASMRLDPRLNQSQLYHPFKVLWLCGLF